MDLCNFEANLVYKVSSRTARDVYTEKPCLKNPNQQQNILRSMCLEGGGGDEWIPEATFLGSQSKLMSFS